MDIQLAKITSAKIALKDLFTKNHFSICTIRDVAKTFNIIIPRDLENIMNNVHCINYNEMDHDFRNFLFKETIKLFAEPCQFNLELIDKIKFKSTSEINAQFEIIDNEKKTNIFGWLK